jgi:methyltransferase (TIGR00027 family)
MKPTRASSTAQVIAASTLLLAGDPRTAGEVAPGAAALCRILLSGSRCGRGLARSATWPWTRALWRQVERSTLPGIISHYWHRKRWIEARCRSAISEGFERIVILGAGFDTLALRLTREFAEIDFIEMDHPATGAAKQQAIAKHPLELPEHLRFVALDLVTDSLPPELFRDGKPTLFIAEGLLMYLSRGDIDRLFASLRDLPLARLRVVFSFMSQWPDGSSGFRPRSRLIEWWLRRRGEPFRWALHPPELAAYLANQGFTLVEMASTPDFSPPGGTGLEGENLAVAERS